jgi:eukaryotic-like serine/threonine-protein kinase
VRIKSSPRSAEAGSAKPTAKGTRLNPEVVIKLLPAPFAGDEERLRRFEQEARAISALNHSNILTAYNIGHHEGAPLCSR